MHKIWAIVRREFVERVRTRWFWIGALLGPVLFGAVFFLSGQLARGGGLKRLAIVDGRTTHLVARASIPLSLETCKISRGTTCGESAAQSFSLAYFMGIILYTAILLYGINVMSSVLEEKTTRIVEVLVSSLRPFQLLLGKVLGVGAVSIFQFLIWGVAGGALLAGGARAAGGGDAGGAGADELFQVPHVTGATFAVFMAYFLGGFFLLSPRSRSGARPAAP